MDILRDHGLDAGGATPSDEAWRGLLAALDAPEDEPTLADCHVGFDLFGRALREPVLLVDAQGGLQRWNEAAEPMVGDCEPGGQVPFRSVVRDDDGEEHTDLIADFEDAIRENEEPMEGLVEGLAGLPDVGPFAYRIIPLGYDTVVGALIRFADRTELRRVEERADRAAQEVGDTERTRAQFVTNTSHELRTPLNGILGMASLLEDTPLSSEQREFVEIIKTSGEALLSLVNDILDFSKFEAGRFDLEIIDYDLERLLYDLADMLATKAAQTGIDLVVDLPPDVPTALLGDPGRVRQVLTNLASNALKFTPEGEVVLGVQVIGADRPKPLLRFEVRDTGVGIASHSIQRLFQPFQQADSTTTRQYGGTGLGLAICKQIVDMMEGTIGVESEIDAGSTFWFQLPLHEQPTIRSGRDESLNIGSVVQGKRVLVVDASETRRRVLAARLESWGATVAGAETAADGERLGAEAEAGERPFDIVLMDAAAAAESGDPPTARRRSGHRLLMGSRGALGTSAPGSAPVGVSIRKPVRPLQLLRAIEQATVGHSEIPEARTPVATSRPSDAKGPRPLLLLAEDNLVNQKVAVQMLTKLGYEIEVVANGKEALDAATTGSFAAVLMDCQMPVMSGYEASEAIRTAEETSGKRIPIIALTAHAMPGDRQRCLDAGMDDYVTKPLRREILAEALSRWVPPGGERAAEPHGVANEEDPATVPDLPLAVPTGTLDEATLDRLRSLEDPESPGFVAEILSDFLAGLDPYFKSIEVALGAADGEALRRAAHTLKGSAANVGAESIRQASLRLEEVAKSDDLSDGGGALENLGRAIAESRVAMEALPEMVTD
jgi:signal transduction histidine kinase/CheY-like chemotaxis protein/HPt (histidine-containing phosphotransfer) domain-containing protein